MKEAEKLSESVLAERVDHKRLPPAILPIHVRSRKVDDAHEDVHSDEQPYLLRTRRPRSRPAFAVGIGCGVVGDGGNRLFRKHALKEAQLGSDVMNRQLRARGN
jgi:hypothetical protein